MISEYEELKREILEVDSEILRLLKRRQEIFRRIGEIKRKRGLPLIDQNEIASRMMHFREESIKLSLDPRTLQPIMEVLEHLALRAQRDG